MIEGTEIMEFRGWLFVVLMTILLTMYLWATGCNVNSAPAPIYVKPSKLTEKQVEGAYVAVVNTREFPLVLLPNGIYRGYYGSYGCSDCQDWSGTWKLDVTNSKVNIKEWHEGSDCYGEDNYAGKWFIYLRFDNKGKVIREGYICQY